MIHHFAQIIMNTGRRAHFNLCSLVLFGTVFICLLCLPFAAKAGGFDTSEDSWAIITGYGQSFPGWGETTQRVETIDLIPRYAHHIINDIGSGWYQGFHSIMIELPVSVIVSQDVSSMVGLNFLACYTFTRADEWQPYIFGGGGPVYSFADIDGMGADWNGNYQFGLGVQHDVATAYRLLLELRYQHISNAGTEAPNEPLNSLKFLIGITF